MLVIQTQLLLMVIYMLEDLLLPQETRILVKLLLIKQLLVKNNYGSVINFITNQSIY
jgi:hypothetical protein